MLCKIGVNTSYMHVYSTPLLVFVITLPIFLDEFSGLSMLGGLSLRRDEAWHAGMEFHGIDEAEVILKQWDETAGWLVTEIKDALGICLNHWGPVSSDGVKGFCQHCNSWCLSAAPGYQVCQCWLIISRIFSNRNNCYIVNNSKVSNLLREEIHGAPVG